MRWILIVAYSVIALVGCGDSLTYPNKRIGAMQGQWDGWTLTNRKYPDRDDCTRRATISMEIFPDDLDYFYDGSVNSGVKILEITDSVIHFTIETGPEPGDVLDCEGRRFGDELFGECSPNHNIDFVNYWRLTKTRDF